MRHPRIGVSQNSGSYTPEGVANTLSQTRWSVPEARTALERLGQLIPGADLTKQLLISSLVWIGCGEKAM